LRLGNVALLAGSLVLAACVSAPRVPPAARDEIGDFALEGRFALHVVSPAPASGSSGGRLAWEHKNGDDHILISSPLGIGVAEIEITPSRSSLRTADGKRREAVDADGLMEEVTGRALPVSRLPAWLLGRAARTTPVERDDSGRPRRFFEAGWQIEYAYDEDAADALPARLTLSRENDVELRLRIEEWKDTR